MTRDAHLHALLLTHRLREADRARRAPAEERTAPMILRPCRPADIDAVMAIWRRASEAGHPFLPAAELDADADLVRTLYIPGAEITVAEEDGRILGFVALVGSFVGGLFVDPAAHRRGVGRRLMADAESRRGSLTLEVYMENPSARAFYSALGYREILCQITDDQGRPHRLVRMTSAEDTASALPAPAIRPRAVSLPRAA
jgi:ribosomal protein S18 acetylase RimI-like enzyme